jgi:hypothetical protein
MTCPHCGKGPVAHYRDAYLRYEVVDGDGAGERIVLAAETRTIVDFDTEELVCMACGEEVALSNTTRCEYRVRPGHRAVVAYFEVECVDGADPLEVRDDVVARLEDQGGRAVSCEVVA